MKGDFWMPFTGTIYPTGDWIDCSPSFWMWITISATGAETMNEIPGQTVSFLISAALWGCPTAGITPVTKEHLRSGPADQSAGTAAAKARELLKTTLIFAKMTIFRVYFLFPVCTNHTILYIPLFLPWCYNE